ncbi:MAG TPA: grasp-with-spasm system SPASM domain peptide maturase [Bacteroidia bacterium]|jgi:SPASM domain peptide maturase of grasp-with-spasm system
MKKIFKLFANCIPVNGAKRHIICDLQKNTFYFIPGELLEILTLSKGKTIDEIKSIYSDRINAQQIDYYVDYLIDNDLAFFCSNPENFTELQIQWDFPGYISNSIIEIRNESLYDLADVFSQLQELGCKFLELRLYDEISIKRITQIIGLVDETKFRNIDIYYKYKSPAEIDSLEKLFNSNQRIGKIIVHSVPPSYKSQRSNPNLVLTHDIISNNDCCGQISPSYFTSNIEMYMESKLFNSCLNKKLSITPLGEIKNCPSTSKIFGNVRTTKLKEAIEKHGFKDYWSINKDQIDVCKACEFRYICTDCRAFIEDSDDIYSKPLKCGYNPFLAEWTEWSTNPLKQKAINFYNKL